MQYKKYILEGNMLVIDPSSGSTSAAGYAMFKNGILHDSGIIEICSIKSRENRLRDILECLQKEFTDPVDVLVIENIEAKIAPKVLIQSCGVYIAALPYKHYFEMNIQTWRGIAMRLGGWKKRSKSRNTTIGDPNGQEGDEVDARYIGYAAIALALGYDTRLPEKDREASIAQTKDLISKGYLNQ